MFGLPMETTLIMAGGILFWVVYTIVFYVRTSSWNLEDADYEQNSGAGPDADTTRLGGDQQ